MSPKRFSVTTTSNHAGLLTRSIAHESTSWWLTSTSGYSPLSSSTTRRQSRDVARTLALSTLVSRPRRARASSNPSRDHPPDLGLRVRQRVAGGPLPRRAGRLLALPEVDAARELADDQQVDAGKELRSERRRRDELGMDRDRPQVRVEAELAAEREQALLRADGRRRVVPLRAADRAEQDRVVLAGARDVLGPDRDAVRVDRVAAGRDVGPLDVEAERLPGRVEDRAAPPRRPRARPRPRDRRDPIGACGPPSRRLFQDPRRDERHRDAVDLGAVELVDRDEVALERRLDDVRG